MKKLWAFLLVVFISVGAWYCFQQSSQKLKLTHYVTREEPIRFLVVHSFGVPVPEFVQRLDELRLSTHYVIDREGQVFQLVPDDKVAWHAGISYWRHIPNLNAKSIGIELQNDTLGQSPFPEKQIDAFVKLAKKIIHKYSIPAENVVSHSDIAPKRKVDVGKEFPWKKVAEQGIGLWADEKVTEPAEQKNVSKLLAQIGYNVTDVNSAAFAFMRRYVPELVPMDPQLNHLEENLPNWTEALDLSNPLFLLRLNQVVAVYPDRDK